MTQNFVTIFRILCQIPTRIFSARMKEAGLGYILAFTEGEFQQELWNCGTEAVSDMNIKQTQTPLSLQSELKAFGDTHFGL